MDIELILSGLASKSEIGLYVLSALGALVVLGGVYVKLTPSKKDDDALAKLEASPVLGLLLRVLVRFSPIARKELEQKEE